MANRTGVGGGKRRSSISRSVVEGIEEQVVVAMKKILN
jgi:hypothetical protein